MRFFKNVKGKFIRVTGNVFCICKHIKSPCGLHGNPETHIFKAADHELSSFIINPLHAQNIFLGLLKSSDSGDLNHGIGRNKKILLKLLYGANEVFGCDHVTESQPCHCIEF